MKAAAELMVLDRLLIVPGVEHAMRNTAWGQFVLAHTEAQKVYGAARESQNERTRKTLKHSTCSHK